MSSTVTGSGLCPGGYSEVMRLTRPGLTMTVPSSRHSAGSVLCSLLVLAAVLLSSLGATGQSATESVRAEPASAAVDVRPAVGPLVSETAGEQGGSETAGEHGGAKPATFPRTGMVAARIADPRTMVPRHMCA